MLNKILSDLAEFIASILMVMKHKFIYVWPYFGHLLRQEISPYIEQYLVGTNLKKISYTLVQKNCQDSIYSTSAQRLKAKEILVIQIRVFNIRIFI